jgi:hypothetical protein
MRIKSFPYIHNVFSYNIVIVFVKFTLSCSGYLPMEYLHGQHVSNKLDIFSLGVVMIKIIAGPGGHSRSVDMPRQEFLDLVRYPP